MSAFDDRQLMRRTLALAEKGYGVVHPNPMVGCVIVNEGAIVAEGWHRTFGGPHAEVDALRRAGARARGAVVYVNLEPCAHHGKTPPCTEAIINAGVREVVVAVKDPHRLVGGKGLSALRAAGIKVRVGVGREEAERLNERFLTCHRTGRPFVGLKWAQSFEGRVTDQRGMSQWITGPEARKEVHRLRAGYDAILVGAGTVLADDPQLTVRDAVGKSPVRVIVDSRLRLSGRHRVFDGSVRTILVTDHSRLVRPSPLLMNLMKRGIEVFGLTGTPAFHPEQLLAALGGEGITSILVEGGPTTIAAFVQRSAFDKVHMFIGPMVFGGGRSAIDLARPFAIKKPLLLREPGARVFSDGSVLLEAYRGRR